MELFDLTKSLVNIPSVTGQEGACSEFVRRQLQEHEYRVELQPVTQSRSNVMAFHGTPEVVLSTHLDTVPPFVPAGEDDEFIYGRGSCDAKGIVASQILAAERLRDQGVDNFGLLFLVGEETTSDGAQAANATPPGSRYIINGEPTENKLVTGSKGNMRLDIRTHGRMAHSAYPHLGDSAIEKLLDILADLRCLALPSDSLLGASTMNIGVVAGGRAANVIPDEARAEVLFRTVKDSTELRAQISQLLEGRCEYLFVRDTPALRMEALEGYETDVVAFTTDLPSLTQWGRPCLLGPGSISVAHTDHERVRKADLVRAVDLYCKLVRELKGKINGEA
jgi:acetylornithine deacetylase